MHKCENILQFLQMDHDSRSSTRGAGDVGTSSPGSGEGTCLSARLGTGLNDPEEESAESYSTRLLLTTGLQGAPSRSLNAMRH